MTPRRRDRFFLSLRQLEERLASESSQIKKTRLVEDNGFADAEPEGLANARTISKYADPTSNEVHVEPGMAHVRVRLPADAHPTAGVAKTIHLESCVAHMRSTGVDLVNVFPRLANTSHVGRYIKSAECLVNVGDNLRICSTDSRETRGICENEAAGSRDVIDVRHGTQGMNDPLPSTIEVNLVHETTKIVARQDTRDASHESRGENGGTEYDSMNNGDAVASSGDGINCVNVDDYAHNRESMESVTLCEDEEQMYDAIFSSDGEDSGSLLVLSARWNPWDMGMHTDGSDSNPPADFVSTPIINNTLDTIDRSTPELSSKCVCGDLQQREGNGLQDLTRLCGLLGLDEHGLRMQDKERSRELQVNELVLSSDQGSPDFGALNHELPGSIFYSNVAKVGDNRFQYAEALDFWLRRILQAQTEPYCRALLLIAKASLQEEKGLSIYSRCKFPSIIQEWLAVQHVVDQQERIEC